MSMKLTHRQAGSLRSTLLPSSPLVPEAPRRQLRLRCSAVTSVPRKRAPAPSTSRPLDNEPASSSGSSLASVSSSIDAPTSSQDEFGQNSASSAASLLSSMDDAYENVMASVHEAEVAVEQAWTASPVGRAWAWYNAKLQDAPVRTKAVTSFFGFVLGDVMAQKIGGGSVHAVRAIRLGMYGLLVDGPAGHAWYKVLDKNVFPKDPASLKAVLAKTAADQLVWAPVMTCVFFAVLKTLEGHPEMIMSTIEAKLVPTIVANYVLWPAAHFVNFRFVPTEHRILYNNCVSVAWNAYLSTLSHAPVLDTEGLLGVIDQAQGLLDSFLPVEIQDNLAAVFGNTGATGHGLEGMKFDIPKSITLEPTRTLFDSILPTLPGITSE